MLTCYRTRRRIGAYLDGALDEGAARATASHLATCGVCQREADGLRRLRTLLRAHLTPAEPDWTGFWPGVVRGIEDVKHRPAVMPARPRRAWLTPPKWAFGGLAAALLLSVGLWQYPSIAPRDDAGIIVTSASTGDPRGTVMVYSTPEQDVAVVWVLGLD